MNLLEIAQHQHSKWKYLMGNGAVDEGIQH
jgi:hypothetical protein